MDKPLLGKRIMITRARAQAAVLAQQVEALGGEAIELPTIEIEAPRDFTALDNALKQIDNYHWVIFTSVNSIEPFLLRLDHAGQRVADLKRLKVAAIGIETAQHLRAAGISVTVVPERYQAEGLLDALPRAEMSAQRVLLPRAAQAREVLPNTLRRWGATVDVVEVYRTVPPPGVDIVGARGRLQRGEIDVLTFTSSSTVRHFVQLFGASDIRSIVGNAAVACIGPITASTVNELGGQVAIMARQFTIDGLVQAIVEYFSDRSTKVNSVSTIGKRRAGEIS
jgi:uroporphyrinogen III methyltransferase / synthase